MGITKRVSDMAYPFFAELGPYFRWLSPAEVKEAKTEGRHPITVSPTEWAKIYWRTRLLVLLRAKAR